MDTERLFWTRRRTNIPNLSSAPGEGLDLLDKMGDIVRIRQKHLWKLTSKMILKV